LLVAACFLLVAACFLLLAYDLLQLLDTDQY